MIDKKLKVLKKRKYVYNNEYFYDKEESASFSAPGWTCVGYQGWLKNIVKNSYNLRYNNEFQE